MAINFNSMDSILTEIKVIMKLQTSGSPNKIPTPIILLGAENRSGLSATRIARNIIQRKEEAGLPVGVLPNGEISSDEKMEQIRAEAFIQALHEDAIVQVAIPPGQTITAAGASVAGPVSVVGSTTIYIGGSGIIK